MKQSKSRLYILVSAAMLICLIGTLAAQPQNLAKRQPPSPLAGLDRALQAAGAAALSTDQEQQLNGLITAFRDTHKPPVPDGSVQTARTNLDNAILKGDKTAAATLAAAIANEAAGNMVARMKDQALFAIDALKVLTADQISLLAKRIGTRGLVQMMQALAGPRMGGRMGGGRMGPGMGGPGLMMPRNPR